MSLHIHSYRPAALLKATGSDVAAFLQGQFTNELRQKAGSAVFGLWLNQKGKVLADSYVLKLAENEFLVVSAASPVAVIRQRLEEYIVADDVALADETAAVHGFAVWGRGCTGQLERVLGVTLTAGQFARSGEVFAFAGRRVRGENYEIIGPEKNIRTLHDQLLAVGGADADAGAVELARITDGIPAIPTDLGPADLPNEGDLEEAAISYTKGCYLGQEVMARLKNLGRVRRRLHVVTGRGAMPQSQAPLFQGEKKIGEIRSGAMCEDGFIAMAMLSLVNLDLAAGLSLAPGEAPTLEITPHG